MMWFQEASMLLMLHQDGAESQPTLFLFYFPTDIQYVLGCPLWIYVFSASWSFTGYIWTTGNSMRLLLGRRIHPTAMVLDELNQGFSGTLHCNSPLHNSLQQQDTWCQWKETMAVRLVSYIYSRHHCTIKRDSWTNLNASQLYQNIHLIWFNMNVLDCYLPNIKVDLSRSTSNVSKIGISHLSWPINNATHNSNLPQHTYIVNQADVLPKMNWNNQVLREITETPGRWEVFSLIWALISWRSKSVRPQEGQETYSCRIR